MGSEALLGVRDHLVGRLTDLGLEVEVQQVSEPDYYAGGAGTTVVYNVLARVRGTNPTGAVALVAHYDTEPKTPGGNDDGSGVAALLESARAVVSGPRLLNDVLFVFTDGEEPQPRFGASAFADLHPWFQEIGVVANLEAVGSSGPSLLVETSGDQGWIIEHLSVAADHRALFSFLPATVSLFGGVGTDFDVFAERGVPGMSFAYLRGSLIYHTERDTAQSVSAASLQQHGEYLLGIAREFGSIDLADRRADAGSEVFFPVTPLVFVAYPAWQGVALALGVLVAFAGVGVIALRRKELELGALGRGVAVILTGAVAAGVVGFVAWWGLTSIRTTPGVWEAFAYLAVIVALSGAALSFAGGAVAGRRADAELAWGIVLVWVALAVATAFALPGLGYLFVWPGLAGVGALGWRLRRSAANWLWIVVGAPAVVLAVPALEVFFQMAQPRPGNPDSDLTASVVVVSLLAALVMALVAPFLPDADRAN